MKTRLMLLGAAALVMVACRKTDRGEPAVSKPTPSANEHARAEQQPAQARRPPARAQPAFTDETIYGGLLPNEAAEIIGPDGMTDGERERMAADPNAERDELVKAHLDEKKRRMAAGIPAPVEATLRKLADGTFDVASQLDPTSAFVYLDYSQASKPVEREVCGSDDKARAELTSAFEAVRSRVAKALADRAVDCGPVVNNLVQCSIGSSGKGSGSLIFAFEIVLGDAQLRRFARERLTAADDALVREQLVRRETALARPVRRVCR